MAQRFLSNIKVNDAYTLPASDGANGQAITTDGAGTLSFTTLGDGEVVKINCKNTSGGTIAKGTPVYITGNVGNSDRLEVAPADASDSTKMPAVGLLETELANNAEGDIIVNGYIKGLITNTIDGTSSSPNNTVYVKSGGGLTLTKPTGTNLIQNIAKVARVHASSGSLVVTSIMRTNDVPNIAENYVWLGNSSGVATATEHLLNNVKDVTTSSPTDGQVLTWDNANSYWKNADASSGGGASDTGTVTIEKDVFDSAHATDPTDGSNTTFDLTSAPAGKNNLQVYVDGVYQAKENFSLSGSTITISPAPPSGVELEVIHIKAITGQITLDKFDGDNSTTAFSMSQSINNENNLQVYINGVYQSKDTYSTSGSTLTLTTAPATGAKVEVVHIKPVDVTSMTSDLFTGDDSTTAFDLTATPSAAGKTMVFIQGVYQEKSTYSISGNTITFTTAPPDGYTVEVTTFGMLSVSGDFQWTSAAQTTNFTATANRGYFVDTSSSAITVTLPSSPSVGDSVNLIDYAGNANTNNITVTSSNDIMDSADDKVIDYDNGAVELIYSGSSKGWVTSSAANETAEALAVKKFPYTAKVLIVAGGGGSIKGAGCGGGGGGGVLEGDLTVTPGDTCDVTVGAGGAADSGSYAATTGHDASQGNLSKIVIGSTTYTANGGGRGGHQAITGFNGGSGGGGGGAGSNSTNKVGGDSNQSNSSPLTGYGNDGGDQSSASGYTGAGGGGGGAAGSSTTGNAAAGGGDGHVSTIISTSESTSNSVGEVNSTSVYYAGGGGGGSESQGYGAAGKGGAGRGIQGTNVSMTAAVYNGDANTGGGAGGAGVQSTVDSAAGGSGVVIFRLTGKSAETITNTGGTVFTSGSDKVVIFKGSGSLTF